MKCCAIATEHHVSVTWGVDLWNGWKSPSFVKNGEELGDGLAFAPVEARA
jgi:hypothetical protein